VRLEEQPVARQVQHPAERLLVFHAHDRHQPVEREAAEPVLQAAGEIPPLSPELGSPKVP
jgi:hypothetical protein